MNFSLNLLQTLNHMKECASPQALQQIEEIMELIGSIKPTSPFYPKNANLIELINVRFNGQNGTATVFVVKNTNGEVQEISFNFTSTESVNRNIENSIYELSIREYQEDSVKYLKHGKMMSFGFLTHSTSGRSNRNHELVSKYTLLAMREDNGEISIIGSETTPKTNTISNNSIVDEEEISAC